MRRAERGSMKKDKVLSVELAEEQKSQVLVELNNISLVVKTCPTLATTEETELWH